MIQILIATTIAVSVLCAATKKSPPTPPAAPDRVVARTVNYGPNDVITVRTRIGYTTMIVLPPSEEIIEATAGDQENWVINGASNLGHVKPTREGSESNLNLITKNGNVYSFILTEGSKTGFQPDLKLFISPKEGLTFNKPKFVTAEEFSRVQAELERMRHNVSEGERTNREALEREIKRLRSEYPQRLNFNYHYERAGAPFNVMAIFNDGTFTYIAAEPGEVPALYEVKDGKPSLIEFQFRNGRYTIPKVLDGGYLAIGKKRLSFARR